MNDKIDEILLEDLKRACYDFFAFEPVNGETRATIKYFIARYFQDKKSGENLDYLIKNIKCDEENNSPELVDAGRVLIQIYEWEDITNQAWHVHKILL